MTHTIEDLLAPGEDRLIGGILESLCGEQPLDLVKLRRLFLGIAQAHFSSASNYGSYREALECLTYNENDPASSELAVALMHTFNPKVPDQRPAVYVGLRPLKFIKRTLGGGYAGSIGPTFDNSVAYTNYGVLGQLLITCIHSSPDVAVLLAESALTCLAGLRHIIMVRLGLESFDPVSIGEPAKESKRPDAFYRCELAFDLAFGTTFETLHESHRLKKLALIPNFEAA